jgi:hypothetical protein
MVEHTDPPEASEGMDLNPDREYGQHERQVHG